MSNVEETMQLEKDAIERPAPMTCYPARVGTRPVLRYHGGKWLLARWILTFFPPHKIYVEPFGGAASCLLQKRRSWSEIYNDLNGEVVNIFKILRAEDQARRLLELMRLTPFSRTEFLLARESTSDALEQARRTMVRYWFGISPHGARTGFRGAVKSVHRVPAQDWRALPEQLDGIIERLRGVTIENEPAIDVMRRNDTPDTLHYCDPPYVRSTRSEGRDGYNFELSDCEHKELAAFLKSLRGMVVLSGYACALYDKELYADWHRFERETRADGASPRVEVLWLNRAAQARINASRAQPMMFGEDG